MLLLWLRNSMQFQRAVKSAIAPISGCQYFASGLLCVFVCYVFLLVL
jgi:hypothetical protein